MTAVAVVTDSTSDLDTATAARYGVAIVPLFVQFGDERFRDVVDLSRSAFYARFRESDVLPTTAQPTAALFEDAFRPHVEAGRDVVCIVINAQLSGTVNAATAAAQAFPDAVIRVVDSAIVSGGLALQVMHAAELAGSGSTADAIVAALAHDRQAERGYAAIPDLSHAVRTGRVSRGQAFVGSLVKIVPVLRFSGGLIEEEARVRTFGRAQDAVVAAAARAIDAAPGARVCVVHADAREPGNALAERLRERISQPVRSFDVFEAGPVIATHAGRGALGAFVLPA